MRKHLLVTLSIIFFGFLIYANSLLNEFQFDDYRLIDNIKLVKDFGSLVSFQPSSRMLGRMLFFLNYKLSGLKVAGYHLVNILVHLFTAILVYWIVYLLLFHHPTILPLDHFSSHLPLFTALLFLVHPLASEPVNYVVARYVLLSTLFSFLALFFFILYSQKKRKIYLIAVVLSFLLAGYSKEIGFVYVPTTIVLYVYFFQPFHLEQKLKKKILTAGVYFLVVILFAYFSGLTGRLRIAGRYLNRYFLTQNKIFFDYLRLMFFPVGLNADHHHLWAKKLFEFPTLIFVFLNASFLFLSFFLKKRQKFLSFSLFWIYLFLLPYFFIVSEELMVEYRVYPAIFGSVLIIAWLIASLPQEKLRKFGIVFLIFFFSAVTFSRNLVWRDSVSLWRDAARKSPEKPRTHCNLGNAYLSKGFIDLAMEEYMQTLKIDPHVSEVYMNLGNAFRQKKDLRMAKEYYEKGLELEPRSENRAKIYFNLASVYYELKKTDEAIANYQEAVRQNPGFYEAHFALGRLYYQEKSLDLALAEFKRTVEIYPDLSGAYNDAGVIYDLKKEYEKATAMYRRAISLDPNFAEAYYNLGITYENLRDYQKAIESYKEALKTNPHYFKAHNNLGNVYQKRGQYGEASKEYEEAIEINPDFSDAKTNLGNLKKIVASELEEKRKNPK